MAVIELKNETRVETKVREVVGTKKFRCNWDETEDPALPVYGSAFDSANPQLVCVDIAYDQDEAYSAIVTCHYSNQGIYGADFYTENLDFSCEVLDTTRSCTWETAGTPVDIPISTIYPIVEYSVGIKVETAPIPAIISAVGKLNSKIFHGCAAETLLFEGANVAASYDKNGNASSFNVTYKFLYRQRSHNMAWREAKQKYVNNMPQYYQSESASSPNYTTDSTKDSQPVYVSGTAGTGAWDKPIDESTGKYRYETCDFAAVLGLPKQAGDE